MASPARPSGGRWRAFAVYATLGPIVGAVLPSTLAVAVLTKDYTGPLWGGSATEWISLTGSAALGGLLPAILTVVSLQVLPGKTRPRVLSAITYGLISAIAAMLLLLPLPRPDDSSYRLFDAAAALGISGLLAGLLCAIIVERWGNRRRTAG